MTVLLSMSVVAELLVCWLLMVGAVEWIGQSFLAPYYILEWVKAAVTVPWQIPREFHKLRIRAYQDDL